MNYFLVIGLFVDNNMHDYKIFGRDLEEEFTTFLAEKRAEHPGCGIWGFKITGDSFSHNYTSVNKEVKSIMNTVKYSNIKIGFKEERYFGPDSFSDSFNIDAYVSDLVDSRHNEALVKGMMDYNSETCSPYILGSYKDDPSISYLCRLVRQYCSLSVNDMPLAPYNRQGAFFPYTYPKQIIEMSRFCVNNGIDVSEFKDRYLWVEGIQDLTRCFEFYKKLDEHLDSKPGITINHYFALSKDTRDFNRAIANMSILDDREGNREEILSKYRLLGVGLINRLYNDIDKTLVNYAKDFFKDVDHARSFSDNRSDDTTYIIDQDLIEKVQHDQLLPLFVHVINSNSGYDFEFTRFENYLKISINTADDDVSYLESIFIASLEEAEMEKHSVSYNY